MKHALYQLELLKLFESTAEPHCQAAKLCQDSKTFCCVFLRNARAKCTTGKKRMLGLRGRPTSCRGVCSINVLIPKMCWLSRCHTDRLPFLFPDCISVSFAPQWPLFVFCCRRLSWCSSSATPASRAFLLSGGSKSEHALDSLEVEPRSDGLHRSSKTWPWPCPIQTKIQITAAARLEEGRTDSTSTRFPMVPSIPGTIDF